MIRSATVRLSVLLLLVGMLASAVTAEVPEDLTPIQELQLRVNALAHLNSAIANARRKADYRASYVDKYLEEMELQADYIEWRSEAETPEPQVADWAESPDVTPDRGVPLTFEDALEMAIELEIETDLDDARNTTADETTLSASEKSWTSIGRKRFAETIAKIMEVERQIAFIKSTDNGWTEFVEWATAELARREEAEGAAQEAARQDAQEQAEQERLEAEEREAARIAAEEQAERERAERHEREWQRKAEEYRLETERIEAYNPPVRYYPEARAWWR